MATRDQITETAPRVAIKLRRSGGDQPRAVVADGPRPRVRFDRDYPTTDPLFCTKQFEDK
jgi:hypothetical protein